MPRLISAVLTGLWAVALVGAHPHTAPAQDKAQITDVFKEHLAVSDPKVVSVRRYDVPPGWVTPLHQHTGHMFLYIGGRFGSDGDRGASTSWAAGQVIHQLPGKPMIMKNASDSARLKFVLFQVGPEGPPLIVPVK